MEEVLHRLRALELEVLARNDMSEHVGSLKRVGGGGSTPSTRPGLAKRIPSFGQGIAKDIGSSHRGAGETDGEGDDSDHDELEEILSSLGTIRLNHHHKGGRHAADSKLSVDGTDGGSTWRTAKFADGPGSGTSGGGRSDLLSLYADASEMRGGFVVVRVSFDEIQG